MNLELLAAMRQLLKLLTRQAASGLITRDILTLSTNLERMLAKEEQRHASVG